MATTAQIGAVLGFIFSFSGLILSIVFVSAVFIKGRRFLNNTDILCVALVGLEGTYCLAVLVAISSVFSDGDMAKLGLPCYVQATICCSLAFSYVVLHFALAIDRYVHTNYCKQVSIKSLVVLVVAIISIFIPIVVVALTSGDAFEVTPSGFVCTFKLTSEEGEQIWTRVLLGTLNFLCVIIFSATLGLYVQMYFKLKKVGQDMTRSGNNVLQKLLYRCIGITTGLILCWTLVLGKFAYSLISNKGVPPNFDMVALLLTTLDPLIIQLTLIVMNKPYWMAIQDTYIKISIASQTQSRKVTTVARPISNIPVYYATTQKDADTQIVSLSP